MVEPHIYTRAQDQKLSDWYDARNDFAGLNALNRYLTIQGQYQRPREMTAADLGIQYSGNPAQLTDAPYSFWLGADRG